jgi:RNA polymerase sigma-70 factor (ECF subfamily)
VTAAGVERLDPFEEARPRLLGLAYRMLGTVADAEDVVQDAWVRWQSADQPAVREPAAWLTTVTTRLAVDRLRAARRRRAQYVGPWLPEPVALDPTPEESAELAESLTLGFLVLLEELGPVERAVFLLADVFGLPFADVAGVVDRSEVACRQIASRARKRLRDAGQPTAALPRTRPQTPPDRHVVDEFLVALVSGNIDVALSHLAPEVRLTSDGGGVRRAALRPVVGPARVARFLGNVGRRTGVAYAVRPMTLNGEAAMVLLDGDMPDVAMVFELAADRITHIRLVRNPAKLAHLAAPIPIE